MKCKFCYVKNKDHGLSLELRRIEEVLKTRDKIEQVSFYGGDLCDNEDYYNGVIDLISAHRGIKLFVSTGGNLLSRRMLERASEKLGKRFSIQLSHEPREWGNRLNGCGDHIEDVLSKKETFTPDIMKSYGRVILNTVIPIELSSDLTLEAYIQRLLEFFKCDAFTLGFHVEHREQCKLPAIVEKFEEENSEVYKKYKNKHLYFAFESQIQKLREIPYLLSNCDAATSIALGPDGEIYSCHAGAADLDHSVLKAKEVFDISLRKWSSSMNAAACWKCSARYRCGGFCYLRKPRVNASYCMFYQRALGWFMKNCPEIAVDVNNTFRHEQERLNLFSKKQILDNFRNWRKSKTYEESIQVLNSVPTIHTTTQERLAQI